MEDDKLGADSEVAKAEAQRSRFPARQEFLLQLRNESSYDRKNT
jgi:hypothetical protein